MTNAAIPGPFVSAMTGNALKIGLYALVAFALVGGGFIWGDTRATRIALQEGAKSAQIQVAATEAAYQKTIAGYLGKLKAQTARGDELAGALAIAQAALKADAAKSKDKISHEMPPNPVCDIPVPVLDELRGQAARR